jgi:2-polyprenyl-6-methoxyphenol hydroxylase-like FAD-dependent oxidoreductase
MKEAEMKAVIVGGGVGGLAAALALARRGWEIEVLERAAAFTEAGTGLSLWANGLRALDALGVGKPVRERASLAGTAGIRDASGRWLSRSDPDVLDHRDGLVAMIHRADLLAVLHDALPGDSLRNAVTVSRVQADGTVVHSEGESRPDLVVGAQWEHPVAVRLRNTALRLLPRSSFTRSLAPVLDWTP